MSQCWRSWCFLALLEVLVGILSTFCTESCMIDGLLGSSLGQNEPMLAILVLPGPVGYPGGILSTFCTESCMIGLLGGCLQQNEQTLSILVLCDPVGGAGWHSEHILV